MHRPYIILGLKSNIEMSYSTYMDFDNQGSPVINTPQFPEGFNKG